MLAECCLVVLHSLRTRVRNGMPIAMVAILSVSCAGTCVVYDGQPLRDVIAAENGWRERGALCDGKEDGLWVRYQWIDGQLVVERLAYFAMGEEVGLQIVLDDGVVTVVCRDNGAEDALIEADARGFARVVEVPMTEGQGLVRIIAGSRQAIGLRRGVESCRIDELRDGQSISEIVDSLSGTAR